MRRDPLQAGGVLMTQRIKTVQNSTEESLSEIDKITTNRVILPTIRKCKKRRAVRVMGYMVFLLKTVVNCQMKTERFHTGRSDHCCERKRGFLHEQSR